MANYGDNYSYVITFGTQGGNEAARASEYVTQLTSAMAKSEEEAKDQTRAFERLRDEQGRFRASTNQVVDSLARQAAAADRAGDAVGQLGNQAAGSGDKWAGLAGGVMQFSQLMDDAQFGARGLMNNVGGLIATLGGFSPAALAAAGVGQLLVGVFRDQIDAALAYAGILDENLVKAQERAAESTDAFAAAQANLLASLPNVTQGVKEQIAQVAELAKQLEGTQAKRLAEQAILEETGYRTQDLTRAQRELAIAQKELEQARALPLGADPGGRRLDQASRAEEAARRQVESIGSDRQQFAQDRFARQAAAAGSNEQAMLQMVQRMAALGQRTGNEDLKNLSQAIFRLTDTYRAQEEAAKLAKEQDEEIARLEKQLAEQQERDRKEAERLQEQSRRKEEAAQEQAAQERERAAQEAARPIAEGAGASIEQALRSGVSPDQAAANLMEQLRTLGYTIEEAFGMASRVTEEVNARVQAAMQAERIRAAQMLRGQNPWRNNRPNGL